MCPFKVEQDGNLLAVVLGNSSYQVIRWTGYPLPYTPRHPLEFVSFDIRSIVRGFKLSTTPNRQYLAPTESVVGDDGGRCIVDLGLGLVVTPLVDSEARDLRNIIAQKQSR